MNFLDKVNNSAKFLTQPINKIAMQLNRGFKDYPYSFRIMLQKYGNEVINSIKIVRIPLQLANQILLNIATLGAYQKRLNESPYDALFHLKIIVNDKYSIEKTTTSKFTVNNSIAKRGQTMDVTNIPPNLTIKELIENCYKVMGKRMFAYHAFYNNCQLFASRLLTSSGMDGYDNFIMQDVASVFKGLTTSRKIMTSTLDVANRSNMLVEGQGLSEDRRGDSFKKLTTTSSSDIFQILQKLNRKIVDNEVFMKDEITNPLQEGFYFMNIESSGEDGSHWTCFLKNKRQVFYFDPFGVFPAQNQFDLFKENKLIIYYDEKQHQDIDSTSCGYWCLSWMYYMKMEKGTNLQKFKNFNRMFSEKDQPSNEKKLLEYFNKIYNK
jgi:hypothetical protein